MEVDSASKFRKVRKVLRVVITRRSSRGISISNNKNLAKTYRDFDRYNKFSIVIGNSRDHGGGNKLDRKNLARVAIDKTKREGIIPHFQFFISSITFPFKFRPFPRLDIVKSF